MKKTPQHNLQAFVHQPKIKSRITVTENIYHSVAGSQPDHLTLAWDRIVESDEKRWQRTFTVGKEWISLSEGCWLKECGLLHVHHEKVKGQIEQQGMLEIGIETCTNPAQDQVPNSGTISLPIASVVVPLCYFLPGEPLRMSHVPCFRQLRMRCSGGSTAATVTVYPP